jgi:YihY family inner membrane protein
MSTASTVPQTYELEGDDALKTLRTTGTKKLLVDSFLRFRAADGFTHARALAFQVVLTFVPFLIAFVGFAKLLGQDRFTDAIRKSIAEVAPGPAGEIVLQAFRQGEQAGGGGAALVVGLIAAVISATSAMALVERGANRLYGLQADRPTMARYQRAFLLACSAGVLILTAFTILALSTSFVRAFGSGNEAASGIWAVIRWPLGIAFAIGGFALLFERSPRRHQPEVSWLAFGSAMSIVLWLVLTGLFAVWLGFSNSFGETYGPLAGLVGLLLWAWLTAIALYLGLAFAAQLEAVRAGVPSPRTTAADEITLGVDPSGRLQAGEPLREPLQQPRMS